ncbi:variant 5, glutathione S-conjugate-exporting ATPase Abc4 [Lathyrus oleraceus]|uniref:Variant 5, glutathione S-conjugate-exporting ATPase Abc4 n=1 Tax=Pisum sativum TaxID=3888 RepID=A0A9D4VLS4_PEA|nr:variant 5, glutathione S-conjugate-exporting ATPase Abc4 [Pisum sativum]
MAASTFCNLTHASLFLNNQLTYFKRCHLVSKRSKCSSTCMEKVLHRRFQLQTRQHYHLHVCCAGEAELSSSSGFEDVGQEDISMETLIWRAIKLPIYSVALVPLTVGSAAAYLHTGIFSAKCYFVLLASSVLVITWLNLSNDVYDFDTGVDKNKKESVVNMVGRNLCCCLLVPCSWLHWPDLGRC